MRSIVRDSIVIFMLALSVRLLHVWQMSETLFFSVLMGDSRGYDTWALRLAQGEWIGNEVFYQAPLYPYFLGTLYSLFGRDLLVVRVIQAVLGAASCVALAYAGARLISPRAGLIAGLALAFYAPAIFFDALIQKSVLDVLFVCLSLALVARLVVNGHDGKSWILVGVTMGALALTRENALILIVVILVWALGRDRGERHAERPRTTRATGKGHGDAETRRGENIFSRKMKEVSVSPSLRGLSLRDLPNALCFAAGVAVVLLPVAIRNYSVGGGFYITTSQFGSNLYIGNNPRAEGSYMALRDGRGSPEFERLDATDLAEEASGRRLTPNEVSSYWLGETVAYVRAQPLEWMSLLARKSWMLANRTEIVDTESQESHAEYSWPLMLLGPVAHFGVVLPFAAIGGFALWPQRRRLWSLYALTLAYALSVILFFVVARYRLPMVPFVIIFAAAGLEWVLPSRRRSKSAIAERRFRASFVGIAALVAVVANWPLHTAASPKAITENNLATALQESGRAEEAVEHYQRALMFQPDYAPALRNVGSALRAAGRTTEALAAFDAALAAGSDNASLHLNRGNALIEQGHLGEGIASFRRALALDQRSTSARAALAKALHDQGTEAIAEGAFDRAVTALQEAVTINPESAEAHNNLGIALASRGQITEAIIEWETALRLKPDLSDARTNLELARGRK